LITGSRGAGKSTFCTASVAAAREAGWRPAGLLSHTIYEGNLRVSIQVENAATREVRPLAVFSEDNPTPGSQHWKFDPDSIAWGNTILETCLPCDLLIIDEIGPLEFERNSGWQVGLKTVDTRNFAIGLVVVRPECLPEALTRWPDAYLVEIDTPEDSARKAQALAEQLF